jgi:hypothetical protein
MKLYLNVFVLASLLMCEAAAWGQKADFMPGHRVLLDAHNCYPYKGQWADRVDRALATGFPLAIEMDLIWDPGTNSRPPRIVVSHGGKATGEEPALRDYFFEKVRPTIEQALKQEDKSQWPLITLNINDLRVDEPAFFPALWNLTGEFESWLCTAPKTGDPNVVAPLDIKPILILTSDGVPQAKAFYTNVPVGERLRLFASGTPGKNADNFHRWINYPWRDVEPEGQPKAGDWIPEDTSRLKSLADRAHKQGYWIRFYTLNGHAPGETTRQGWLSIYNFGSLEAVAIRWKAAKAAGVDFIASDQYEDCIKVLRQN